MWRRSMSSASRPVMDSARFSTAAHVDLDTGAVRSGDGPGRFDVNLSKLSAGNRSNVHLKASFSNVTGHWSAQ
jgi:hypothetical protein